MVLIFISLYIIFCQKILGPKPKKKHGPNHGWGSQKLFNMTQRKFFVYLKDYEMRLCGDSTSSFANEISIIMQNRVSQRLEGCSQVSADD